MNILAVVSRGLISGAGDVTVVDQPVASITIESDIEVEVVAQQTISVTVNLEEG